MTGRPTLPVEVRDGARRLLEAHWIPEGYTAPNPRRYPWLWLWDSCFCAIAWAELGDERAVVELRTALGGGDDDDAFVPHMRYVTDPDASVPFWGRRGESSITQPPMYGHAVAELLARGFDLDGALVDRARAALRGLLHRRARRPSGLIVLVHPWESGADDSPRWDDWCPGGWDRARWRAVKGELVTTIERTESGAPIANPAFAVGGVGFNALVAFNAVELGRAVGDDELVTDGGELAEAVDARWNTDRATWCDDAAPAGGSGQVRTADALTAVLVTSRPRRLDAVFAQLDDGDGFGGRFGPPGVHRAEPAFDPTTYWRGPVWPQLGYLLWLGARRLGRDDDAAALAEATTRGVVASGWAEYWDPDTGEGLGAIPQSWSALAVVMNGADARG